jgi:hypothetical protein
MPELDDLEEAPPEKYPTVDEPTPPSNAAVLVLLLLISAAAVTVGVSLISVPAGWITAGVLLAAIAFMSLAGGE